MRGRCFKLGSEITALQNDTEKLQCWKTNEECNLWKSEMPKVVLFIATSLDGYIASPDGTVDWLFHDADYGYTEFMASVDAVVMGRKTWEQAKTFEDVPFAGKKVIVFSRSQSDASEDRIRIVQGDPSTTIAEIQSSVQKDIWLVGGGDLIQQLIASNLIDEFRLFVHPIILGQGIPLFTPHSRKTNLSFEGSESFPSGLVELRYRRHHHTIEDTQNEEI
jgi:dihydrofolate reductase